MTLLRRRKTAPPLILLLIFAAAIIFGGFMFIECILKNTLFSFAEAEASWRATEVIHEAVLEEIGTETTYEDIIHIEKDDQNRIIFMQANIIKLNRLASGVALNIENKFRELKSREFDIPIGQLTGNMLFANFGPRVKFVLLPVGTSEVIPEDSFEQAGINQTRHKIYLNVNSKISISIPFIRKVVTVKSKIPIADAVIVGEVPETYLEFSPDNGLISSDSFKGFIEKN